MSSGPAESPLGARPIAAPSRAFFFASGAARLFGVWRAPVQGLPARIWVFCAPFAEEEKSARRTLAELGAALGERGDASLLFSYTGTGDSEGHFSSASLDAWRSDIRAACAEARRLAPGAQLGLVGLRLGAALAVQVAAEAGAKRLVLLEPVLQGRTLLAALNQKKRLRAMMTKSEGGMINVGTSNESLANAGNEDDFDGWPLTRDFRTELDKLDVTGVGPFSGVARVYQIGPREGLLPATESWAQGLGAKAQALRMQPFWNLTDYAPADALLATLADW